MPGIRYSTGAFNTPSQDLIVADDINVAPDTLALADFYAARDALVSNSGYVAYAPIPTGSILTQYTTSTNAVDAVQVQWYNAWDDVTSGKPKEAKRARKQSGFGRWLNKVECS